MASDRHAEHAAARGTRVLTLKDLAARLVDARYPEQRETSAEATRLLTRQVLRDHPPALAVAVDDALGQLRRAGTGAEDLARAGGSRGLLLSSSLRRIDARLEMLGLRDHRSVSWLAAGVLGGMQIRELSGIRRARVRGFSRWDNGELALLEALHRELAQSPGGGVTIELPTLPEHLGSALRDAVNQLASRLEQRWASAADHPELEFVDARAAAQPPQVVEAAQEASEARAVARAVLEALARGSALDSIAIVPVDASEAFLEPLRAELNAAKVPFSEAWSRPTSSAPEAHAALELLRLAQGPLLRDSLVDVLRVPDLSLESLLGERPSTSFIDVLSRLPVRVDRNGRELMMALASLRQRSVARHEREAEAISVAERVLSALLGRFEQLREPSTRRVFRERWRAFFAELGLLTASRRGLSQAIRYAERADHAPLAALGENARAGRAIELALERVSAAAELLGASEERLSLPDFYEEFATALAAVGPSQGASRAGTLRVARASDVAGLDWDLLIVCRAASSTLDWQSATSDGVLDGELLEQLPPEQRPLGAADRASFTRLALAHALSRSSRSLVTWAKRDARGGSGASRLVMNLNAADTRQEPASPLDPAAQRVVRMPEPSVEVRARAQLELERQAFYANPDSPLSPGNGAAGALGPWVGGERERPLALTQLERYARCAFLGFSGVVLRAVRDDTVGDGLSARERGNLIHEALAVALTGTRERFGSADPAQLEAEALARADAFLRAQISSNLRGAALGAALEDVAALLRWSFANSDGIWFAEAERAFGNNEAWGPLPVGEHFVSGRIDRIDRNSDGSAARVIDYKTGTVRLTGEHGEQLLQPWLYAQKVAQESGATRVSSGYLSLQRRKPEWKAALENSEPSAAAIADKLLRAEELLLSLRGGRVPARPAVPGSCARCDARDICRRPLSAPHEANE